MILTDEDIVTYSRRNNSLIMVRVDTHTILLEVKGKLAELGVFQFIFM